MGLPDDHGMFCLDEEPLIYAADWMVSNGWTIIEFKFDASEDSLQYAALKAPGQG